MCYIQEMRIGIQTLLSQDQTGSEMRAYIKKFWRDLGPMIDTTLQQIFDHVRLMPYKEDEKIELISRPKFIFKNGMADCKKKAILLCSWAEAHGIKWRLIGASETPDKQIHHVFPQFFLDGKWKNVDATFPEFYLFQPKPNLTRGREL